ncbi:Lrp/AsnC family transcriptional regulator [Actinomadura madurae]|uniref:Lrp/AsnC family transcriptional regulator n=1 Tax=Actinomadura madurae TaxID=1993 RepID=UPI0020D200AE|nr:Lrp/AsnC family transcriptional regulator [Actinomadura madurae]MCQ0016542.1 Lrp/AsnC family transcriptional regulator [Actinomadura madurae]
MAATGFDELDLAIVDAVRTAPRASWRDLGAALGVNPSTVSRRWSRMESSGAAWVTAHPSGGAMPVCALVELDCEPGRAVAVARDLVPDREAASIKVTSGPRDVVVLVQTASLQALSDYLLGLVPRVPGIARVRSHLLTRSTLEVSRWRDGTLDPEQRRRLDPPPAAGAARARRAGRDRPPDPRRAARGRADAAGAHRGARRASARSPCGAGWRACATAGW